MRQCAAAEQIEKRGNAAGYASVWLKGAHEFTVAFAIATVGLPVYITSAGALSATATDNSLYGYALTTKAAELTLRFGGLNEVDSGKPVVTDMWRVSQGVTKQLAHIISKGFGKLEVEGSLMKDPTKTGAGISQYMRTTLV